MRVYQKRCQQIQGDSENPGCVIKREDTWCSQKSTLVQSSKAEASKENNSQPQLKLQYGWGPFFSVSPGVSSKKGKETSVIFQVVSFMICAGTWPTIPAGLLKSFFSTTHRNTCGNHCQSLHENQTEGSKCSSISSQMAAVEEMDCLQKTEFSGINPTTEMKVEWKIINHSILSSHW